MKRITVVKRILALALALVLTIGAVQAFAQPRHCEHVACEAIRPLALSIASPPSILPLPTASGFITTLSMLDGGVTQLLDFTAPGQADFFVDVVTSATVGQTLNVSADFTAGSTTRTIEIELTNGLAISNAPGMTGSGGTGGGRFDNWTFNAALLPPQLVGVVQSAEWVQNPIIEQFHPVTGVLLNSYRPRSGRLIYTLYNNAPAVSMDIIVVQDAAFSLMAPPRNPGVNNHRYHANAITVTVEETGQPTRISTLERYVMNERVHIQVTGGPQSRLGSRIQTVQAGLGAASEWTQDMAVTRHSNVGPLLTDTITFDIRVPHQLTSYDDLNVTFVGTTSSITSDMFSYTIATEPSGNFLITVTLTHANLQTIGAGHSVFEISGRVPATTPQGSHGAATLVPAVGVFINIPVTEGTNVTTLSTYNPNRTFVHIAPPFENALLVQAMNLASRQFWSSSAPAVLPMAPLGGFSIRNPHTQPLTDQAVQVTFPPESLELIGVRGFRLPAGVDGIQNITATTVFLQTDGLGNILFDINGRAMVCTATPGNTITKATGAPLPVDGVMTYFPWVNVSFYNQLAPNEFIASVFYELYGDVPTDADNSVTGNPFFNPSGRMSFVYYGTILNPLGVAGGTQVPAIAVAGQLCETNPGEIDGAVRTTATTIMIASDIRNITLDASTSRISGFTLQAGQTRTNVSATFNQVAHQWYPDVMSVQGFYVYLRSPAGVLDIVRDSISATWGGVTFSEAEGNLLIYDGLVDSTGSRIYRLEFCQVILGRYRYDLTRSPALIVNMDVRALSNASTTSVPLQDLFMISTISDDIIKGSSGRLLTDTFYIGDNRTMPGQRVGVPPGVMTVTAAQTLVNWLDGRIAGTSNWTAYDWDTGNTVLNLPPSGSMQQRFNVYNRSGFEVNGLVAFMPVPKIDEWVVSQAVSTAAGLQQEAFGFGMNLTAPVTAPVGFTVTYSTVWSLSRTDNTNFRAWGDIPASERGDIRMVRISNDFTILDGVELEFVMELEPDIPTDGAGGIASILGNMNRYAAYVWRNFNNNEVYLPSQPLAVRMWQRVTFLYNYDDASEPFYYIDVVHGGTIIQPADPVRTNFNFIGWTTDAAGTTPFDFNTIITDTFDLYAQWEGYSDITVEKYLTGDMANPDAIYTFHIYFYSYDEDVRTPLPASTTFDITSTRTENGSQITLDANGRAIFTLQHTDTIVIEGVLVGTHVRIVEQLTEYELTYVYTVTIDLDGDTVGANGDTGRIAVNDDVADMHFTFTNRSELPPPTGVAVADTGILVLSFGLAMVVAASAFAIFTRRKIR